jgi:hypothetical protein
LKRSPDFGYERLSVPKPAAFPKKSTPLIPPLRNKLKRSPDFGYERLSVPVTHKPKKGDLPCCPETAIPTSLYSTFQPPPKKLTSTASRFVGAKIRVLLGFARNVMKNLITLYDMIKKTENSRWLSSRLSML